MLNIEYYIFGKASLKCILFPYIGCKLKTAVVDNFKYNKYYTPTHTITHIHIFISNNILNYMNMLP
jgi:hypothetical protein